MNATYRSPASKVLAAPQPAVPPAALVLLMVMALLFLSVPRLFAQDLLASARAQYEAAAYDEALNTLQRLNASRESLPNATLRAVEEYRFLCLMALGKMPEARESMAAAVAADPLHQLDASSTSPRILTTFQEVRREVLPGLTGELYGTAKDAYERKEYTSAQAGFRTVLALLDDPDMQGKQADLETLAKGFLDLSVVAIKAAEAPPAPVPAPAPAPVAARTAPVVVPPVVVRQVVPPMPPDIARLAATRVGVLEIVIDETGKVEEASFSQGIHPVYDNNVLVATKSWRYQPATSNGVPMKFTKTIKVAVNPTP